MGRTLDVANGGFPWQAFAKKSWQLLPPTKSRRLPPYRPRPLAFLGVEAVSGHRLKIYAIRYSEAAFERARFAAGWASATAALPQPDVTSERPGAGFVVLHQAQGDDYLILGWWDRQNELPTRVFLGGPGGWRPARGGESFCVWDLRVMWWEREAYLGTALAGRADGVEAYLGTVTGGYA